MKSEKDMRVMVIRVVAASLFVAGFIGLLSSGFGGGGLLKGLWRSLLPVAQLCYILGAVGVIWLSWYWLKVAQVITSIADFLKSDKSTHIEHGDNPFINTLIEAVNGRMDRCSAHKQAVEKQIKDLKMQIQLLQRQKNNTEAIIYSIRDAVIVIDEFDKLLMANEAAGRLFDFDFKNSQYSPLSGLINENEFADFLHNSRTSKVRHTRREIEFQRDGIPKTFDCIVSCVYANTEGDTALQKSKKKQSEQICGVVAVLHDITREKEVSQMKNDFVNHVSHELKTPLASITAYSEMLVDGEADDEETRKEFYSVIQSQAKRLNRLIEDMLNISRIESGLIKVEKAPVSLTILIEEQLQMIKSFAEEKNIKVVGQKPIIFEQVNADKDMVSQVIVNLLSNAVKYTPSGGSVRIDTEVDEAAKLVRVSVTDTGVGIPEGELGHVFEKFYRVSANNGLAKGTGLGLNLVKQIVEKVHGGRVFVTSQVGVGSTFGFELPLATAELIESSVA